LNRWNLAYLFHPPWDTGVTPPEVIEVVERGELRPGRALDLGCGTGTNVIYLARHGFDTVGVDAAWLALWKARRKAKAAGVHARFLLASVLDLDAAQPDPALREPFDFCLDIGCFHSFGPAERVRYTAGLRRVVRPGGLYLLYALGPRQMGSRMIGLTPDQVRESLAEEHSVFRLRWERQGSERGAPSGWYCFERMA
jgi:cyclopropane fatty-acyl-phospholipid synthase-like methyltransferase